MDTGKEYLEVILSAQKGDEEAWSELVTRYSKLVWSATYGYGFSDADREDIVQEVFLRLVKNISSYNPNKSKFSTFIATITKRACIDKLRKNKTKSEEFLTPEELASIPSPLQEDPLYTQEIIKSLNKAVDEKLTTEQRLVIKLFYFKKCSYNQISRIMNRDEHWVKNTLHRTRAYLKQFLTKSD